MREQILLINMDEFVDFHFYASALEMGAAIQVAMHIAVNGPLDISEIRKVAGLRGRAKWLHIHFESMIFRRDGGKLYLNDDVFRIKYRGSNAARSPLSLAVRELIHERDGYRCVYCGSGEGPFEVDHIYPVSRGGTNDLDNLCLSCKPCNRSKSNKTLEEWEVAQ